ncbi:MAG TPA: hypothetical protein VNL13_06055 [Sulfolobales archaeon]|nr:hypothetical protein [Sulfolobales archaeon]
MPEKDKLIGGGLMLISAAVLLVYIYGLFFNEALGQLLIKLTVFVAVAGVMGILGWIGYTLATTPPPKPLEEIEKEIEEELKKLEGQKGESEKSSGAK